MAQGLRWSDECRCDESRVTNPHEQEQRMHKTGTKNAQDWNEECTRLERRMHKTGTKNAQDWNEECTRLERRMHKTGTKTGSLTNNDLTKEMRKW